MSVLLLVRHGQASYGSEDYDRLSTAGLRQSRVLGAALKAQQVDPARILSGTLRRQQETAAAIAEGAGWVHRVEVEPAWDEFDMLTFLQHAEGPAIDSRSFQRVLDHGMRQWAEGTVPDHSGERFTDFVVRVESALQRAVTDQPGSGPVVVTSSAGVISWVVTSLLGGGVEQWISLNRVCVNAAVTRVVHGRQGVSLVSFNEHGHFTPSEITYR